MKKNLILCIIVSLIFCSCASLNTIKKGKESGEYRLYKTSFDNAWVYSLKIFRESGITIEEQNQMTGAIIGSTPAQMGSYGSYIGVWIENADKGFTKVTVYNRRVLATQLKAGFTADDFFARLDRYVAAEN
jgi:hypothetical protein